MLRGVDNGSISLTLAEKLRVETSVYVGWAPGPGFKRVPREIHIRCGDVRLYLCPSHAKDLLWQLDGALDEFGMYGKGLRMVAVGDTEEEMEAARKAAEQYKGGWRWPWR